MIEAMCSSIYVPDLIYLEARIKEKFFSILTELQIGTDESVHYLAVSRVGGEQNASNLSECERSFNRHIDVAR